MNPVVAMDSSEQLESVCKTCQLKKEMNEWWNCTHQIITGGVDKPTRRRREISELNTDKEEYVLGVVKKDDNSAFEETNELRFIIVNESDKGELTSPIPEESFDDMWTKEAERWNWVHNYEAKQKERQLVETETVKQCVICCERGKRACYYPCGHQGCYICLEANEKLDKGCHVCRKEIKDIIELYD